MKFTRDNNTANTVRGISEQGFKFGDEWLNCTLAICDGEVISEWTSKPFSALRIEDFSTLLETKPELVVIGTGDTSELTPRELMFGFARLGCGLEVMDSRAAARTYNVLVSEDRPVAAVLYPL